MNYYEIIERSKQWPIHYELANFHVRCLKTQFSEHPWSIAECEYEFLQNKIRERNCKCGFEIGTGTGISSIGAGLAFKETSGYLVTLDPFVEEFFGRCDLYSKDNREQSLSGVGLRIQYILDSLGLPVDSVIGWSPQDIESTFPRHFESSEKLDYVFIDGRHQSDSTRQDFDSILPFLADSCILFFHDVPCINTQTQDYISEKLGTNWVKPEQFKNPYGFNLSYLER